MPKITKAKGLTISDARTGRTPRVSAVASVAVTDEGELEVVGLEVPRGTIAEIVAWVGDDRDRAEAVADDERKGVREAAAKVLDTEND